MRYPAVFAGALALLVGCGGAESGDVAAAEECVEVSPEKLAHIQMGLNGYTLSQGGAVASGDWFLVAAEMDGAGLEGPGHVGTWAVSDLNGTDGMVLAADEVTRDLGTWGDATTTDLGDLSMSDQAITARSCARG